MRSPFRLFPVLALAVFAACSDSTAPTLPSTLYPLGPAGWQLASVNGKPVSYFSDAAAYSFRANAGDLLATRVVPVYGLACTFADGRFVVQREIWTFVDTVTVAPRLPAQSPYGGWLTAKGTATAVAANAWRFADTLTARRSGDSLVLTFTREGPAVYVFVDAGVVGRQNCAL